MPENRSRKASPSGRKRDTPPSVADRSGGILVILFVLLLLFGGGIGGSLYLGSAANDRIEAQIISGKSLIDQEKTADAIKEFIAAEGGFSALTSFFRSVSAFRGKTFTPIEDIRLLVVTSALLKIYEEAFEMRPAKEWVETAEARIPNLSASDALELKQLVSTGREISDLCSQFQAGKHSEVMRGLLTAEKNALPQDQDFFIQEIRTLIACGKEMNEPDILNRAREMLFFLSFEAGIKNKRIDQLWGILNR